MNGQGLIWDKSKKIKFQNKVTCTSHLATMQYLLNHERSGEGKKLYVCLIRSERHPKYSTLHIKNSP
jgi:hypothetical protein